MARDGEIYLGGQRYQVLADADLPRGKRAYVRESRPSQTSDPGRISSAVWTLSGPLGFSRERDDHILACDYTDNLDTIYEELLTSSPAGTNMTLSTQDPSSFSGTALLGSVLLGTGTAPLGGGTADVTAGNLTHIDQQASYLFFHRGPFSTQVNSSWSLVETVVHDAQVQGAATWQGFGWVGLGANSLMQKRTGVTSSGSTYSDVSAVYAGDLKRGTDRLWYVAADTNKAGYTPDAFSSTATFTVGDDGRALNGIGTLGPFTVFGAEDGVFSFTDAGKPVVAQDLEDYLSPNNGLRHMEMWGWDYYVTQLGLFAWTPNVTNPVGLEALKGFEGAIDGRPIAIGKFRDSLIVSYLTTGGDSYLVRGIFGPNTDATGEPQWYPFKKLSSVESHYVGGVASPFVTNPHIIAGRGTNAVRYVMGRRGRDIADSNYVFSTEGGTWYGTTLMRLNGMHANLRYATFFTENCTALNTWQLAVSCDGDDYVNVDTAVVTNGHQVVRPVAGNRPRDDVDFHMIKPRLTQVAASSSSPPQIRGKLTLYFDERPETITEIKVYIGVTENQLDSIFELADHNQSTPIEISLPGKAGVLFGIIADVKQAVDVSLDAQQAVALSIHLWEVG